MDNAMNAVNKLFARDSVPAQAEGKKEKISVNASPENSSTDIPTDGEAIKDTEVTPAVEHTHVSKQHETREQTFVEKERHQDHYHTTIQPLKDSEVLPEKHDYEQETKTRNVNNDDGAAKKDAQQDRAGFQDTIDEKQFENKTKEPTVESEHVHHHLHETVQPVIEKGKLLP